MVSSLHEALATMVRDRPALVPDLLSELFKVDLPAWDVVRLESNDVSEPRPAVFLADAPVALTTANGKPLVGIVCEVQLRRDTHKRFSWPHYVTSLRVRLKCPTILLVICADATVAEWCAQPIELGHPGCVLSPLVLGPAQVPAVTDPDQAERNPELAVLSAMAHGSGPDAEQVLRALASALRTVDQAHLDLYTDTVHRALPEAARHALEAFMDLKTYEFQSDLFRGLADKRAAKEKAKDVLVFLEARGIEVPDQARTTIAECTDLDQLDTWVRRAATAESINDVLN